MPEKTPVGIFRIDYPNPSEAFIPSQAAALSRYDPVFITRTWKAPSADTYRWLHADNTVAVAQLGQARWRQRLFTLTRSPGDFLRDGRLSTLRLLHAHFGHDGVYATPLARELNVPLVVTMHGYDVYSTLNSQLRSGAITTYQFLWHKRELHAACSRFIAVSHFIRGMLIEQGYPEDKIIPHYIGINTQRFIPSSEPRGPGRYLLCVARHVDGKGIDVLLHAFARLVPDHPDVTLVQVGSGPETARLEQLACELGVASKVEFMGNRTHDEVVALMQQAEVFVLPTRWKEGLPTVVIEASACGVPVVGTRAGGTPEAIRDGETGFLTVRNDAAQLAAKIRLLLSNPAQARRMGEQGRNFVLQCFDLRTQTEKLESLYDEVLTS